MKCPMLLSISGRGYDSCVKTRDHRRPLGDVNCIPIPTQYTQALEDDDSIENLGQIKIQLKKHFSTKMNA